jgi:hypothetical protein
VRKGGIEVRGAYELEEKHEDAEGEGEGGKGREMDGGSGPSL